MHRPVLLALCVVCSNPAMAVDHRWGSSFAQGTVEAIVKNLGGASVNIYCPSGQVDTPPGIFLRSSKLKTVPGQSMDVQFVVDGNNYPFSFTEGHLKAETRIDKQGLWSPVAALRTSKAKQFTVEWPKQRVSEAFPLSNASDALSDGKKPFVDVCT